MGGSAGQAVYFTSHHEHHDIISWAWEVTPHNNYTVEFWLKTVDIFKMPSIFSYAVFDETVDPMYNTGFDLSVVHLPHSVWVAIVSHIR